jgi:hypothetical protein
MNKINRFIYCILDDIRADQFFHLMNKGLLPNFRQLCDEGMFSENCVTDFPAVTYPTQVSMLTGTYTGDYRNELCHGVPLYNWMGRDYSPPFFRSYGTYGSDERIQIYKMNEDIGNHCQTILEMINNGNKASILQFINRGADYFYPETKLKFAFYYLLLRNSRNIEKYLYRVNTLVVKQIIDVFEKPRNYFELKEAPIASLLWFPSPDILLHLYGSTSKQYILNMIHIDKVFGVLLKELSRLEYLDDTAIAIVSDHGNYPVKTFGKLLPFMNKNGFKNYHPRKNIKGTINITDFGSVGFINVKSRDSYAKIYWKTPKIKDLENYGPKKINLLSELFKIGGCQLMYYKEDNCRLNKGKIHLKRKLNGSGSIISGYLEYHGLGKDLQIKYVHDDPNYDIFDYCNDELSYKLIDNKFHTPREWIESTAHIDYPIYPELIVRHFKNPRGADIIISTKGNVVYEIKHGAEKKPSSYTHDIGLRSCAIVPLGIGGSKEIPSKKIPFCRTIDIVPTLLKMIQRKPHKSVLGESLI